MDALPWIDDRLAAAGLERRGEPEVTRSRPWGTVTRIDTDDGTVWFKAAAPATAFEAGLYELLARVVPERILVPLGVDAARGWMLLPDGGAPLGETTSEEERDAGLARALVRYGELQRELEPHVDELLALGVADMRPAAMPVRFEQALEAVPAGDERDRIAALRPQVADWCAELAESPLPASLDHNDLHPFNVLAGDRFYDWGDAVVAHPFAVTLVPLAMLGGSVEARDAYLRVFGEPEELAGTLAVAARVATIARALIWERALRAWREEGTPIDPRFADAPLETLSGLLDP